MTCGLCERREADRRFIVTGATGPIDYPACAECTEYVHARRQESTTRPWRSPPDSEILRTLRQDLPAG